MNTSQDKTLLKLERVVETATGEKADDMRRQTISERRKIIEARKGTVMRFISKFPFIGRGSVMRDKVVDHASVEKMLKEASR